METRNPAVGSHAAEHREVIAAMDAQAWDRLYLDLIKYAMHLMRDNHWAAVWNGRLPGAREAHDIVMETVQDFLDETRNADPALPLVSVLKMVIKSKVSHLLDGLENRTTVEIVETEEEADSRPEDFFPDTQARPDEVAATKDAEAQNSKLLDLLLDELSDDDALFNILGCLIDGLSKRDEIAKALAMTPREVTNHGKRLDRRLAQFREKHAETFPFLKARR
jgi:hypothetical protein